MNRQSVLLLGASGTMGYQAFKELWKRKASYDIAILARPSAKNKALFARYEQEAGIEPFPGKGTVESNGFKVVWGDATDYDDVEEAVRGVDWVLDAMAFISPAADYYPEIAKAVNTDAIVKIVRAIEAQPNGAEHIKLVYTGTVAETGDRLGSIRWGRVGDPLKPSVFDYYAVTKIAGERAVLESNIKHWASLRMTFIMPTDYGDYSTLADPIMFHQPLNSCMENMTDRDAGYGLVNALEIADDSDFWRRVYNMGGGPTMRCTAYEYSDASYKAMGMSGIEAVTERKWFALRNFHMQYYEDSGVLNDYLRHWRDSLDDFWQAIGASYPPVIKITAYLCSKAPFVRKKVQEATYEIMRKMAEQHRNGTAHWYKNRNDLRISAFYKDYETYEAIPDWDGTDPVEFESRGEWQRLDHGYDESKDQLDLGDLQGAAGFRGGQCLAAEYFDEQARHNPFFAQVWVPNHDPDENNSYPEEACHDIVGADKDEQ